MADCIQLKSSEKPILFCLEPIADQTIPVTKAFVESLPEYPYDWLVSKERLDRIRELAIDTFKRQPSALSAAGTGTNIALCLSRLPGNSCKVFGSLGKRDSDRAAAAYYAGVEARGINTSALEQVEDQTTAQCLCLVTEHGERYMPIFIGAAKASTADKLSPELFKGIRHLHLEGYRLYSEGYVERAIELAKQQHATVSLDAGATHVVLNQKEKLLKILQSGQVDVFIGNEEEMKTLTGMTDAIEICRTLGEHCTVVAMTLGKDGCCLKDRDDNIQRFSAYPTTVLDTTAAGDCFTAGLLHGWLNDFPTEQSAHYATVLASSVIALQGNTIDDMTWEIKVKQALEDWNPSTISMLTSMSNSI